MSTTMPKNIQDLKKMKIQDALQLLEDSAKESSDDMQSLLTERYKDMESAVEKLFGATPAELFDEAKDQVKAATKRARKVAERTISSVDENVHENPWAYIGGGVAVGAVLGFLLGRK